MPEQASTKKPLGAFLSEFETIAGLGFCMLAAAYAVMGSVEAASSPGEFPLIFHVMPFLFVVTAIGTGLVQRSRFAMFVGGAGATVIVKAAPMILEYAEKAAAGA